MSIRVFAVLATVLACAASAHSQASVTVTFNLLLNELPTNRPMFNAAFKQGFTAAVNLAGCFTTAPSVQQSVTYVSTGGLGGTVAITFPYPINTPALMKGVALVVANPDLYFSVSDPTISFSQVLVQFLAAPGGFSSVATVPALRVPASSTC